MAGNRKFQKQNDSARPNDDDFVESTYIEGRNAVLEAFRAGRTIDKVYILHGANDAAIAEIRTLAKSSGAAITECDRAKLDQMTTTGVHQGIIASAAAHEYVSVKSMVDAAREAGEDPLIVICDGIFDPHNLGAIIRTAGAAGAHGVVISRHRSVGLTAVVAKSAAGALEYVPVARVANITNTINELKEYGLWIFGTSDRASENMYKTKLTGPAAFIIGSEGEGMSRLVSENCDVLLSIPMKGKIASLNASNAAAVVLFEAVRQRGAQ